jgi:hypothetical protein
MWIVDYYKIHTFILIRKPTVFLRPFPCGEPRFPLRPLLRVLRSFYIVSLMSNQISIPRSAFFYINALKSSLGLVARCATRPRHVGVIFDSNNYLQCEFWVMWIWPNRNIGNEKSIKNVPFSSAWFLRHPFLKNTFLKTKITFHLFSFSILFSISIPPNAHYPFQSGTLHTGDCMATNTLDSHGVFFSVWLLCLIYPYKFLSAQVSSNLSDELSI